MLIATFEYEQVTLKKISQKAKGNRTKNIPYLDKTGRY